MRYKYMLLIIDQFTGVVISAPQFKTVVDAEKYSVGYKATSVPDVKFRLFDLEKVYTNSMSHKLVKEWE